MKKFIALIFFAFTILSHADFSLRRCMLLPMSDYMGGAVAYETYELVEKHLKESEWCLYRPNSEILNILTGYRKNLQQHLQNKEVLKVIAEKTGSGSLIKVDITKAGAGTDLKIKIYGQNGTDVYFSDKTRVDSDDVEVLAQTINNWLSVYEKSIPYNGRIVGVLGNQYTIDAGKLSGVLEQSEVIVSRPVKKKKHPLLKEIVDWDTIKIGTGRIFFVGRSQSQGKMIQYDTTKRLKVGDWVNFRKESQMVEPQKVYERKSDYEFGKLGLLKILFSAGSSTATANKGEVKRLSGFTYGVDLGLEIWGTRHFWGALDIHKKFGDIKKDSGTLNLESSSYSFSKTYIKVGYRYLPLGFFYGPQIDGYTGFGSVIHEIDTSTSDGFTEFTYKGLLLGVKGSIPVMKKVRAFIDFNFLFSPNFEQKEQAYSGEESASTYNLVFGGRYEYGPSINFDAEFAIVGSKAEFESTSSVVKNKDSSFKIGGSYSF